jgi:peptide subunit release factor 1 (eRF1)
VSKNRITIECWKCKEKFTKLVPEEERKGVLLISCPFCGAECKIEFESSSIVTLFRSKKI